MKRVLLLAFILVAARHAAGQDTAAERQIFDLLNGERVSHGLKALEFDSKLSAVAENHSVLMLLHRAISHQFPNEADAATRIVRTGVGIEATGENVASSQNAESAHKALMNSPPHRANILDPKFTSVGIGVVRSGETVYVTQDFARTVPRYSIAQAEHRVLDYVDEIRRSAGNKPLPVKAEPELRKLTCEMAREGRISMTKVGALPGVSTTVVFTTADLSKTPSGLEPLKKAHGSGISVGVCYAAAPSTPIPQYWVAIVTYF